MKAASAPKILLIGSDPPLAYLIGRYAERGGYRIMSMKTGPSAEEVQAAQPFAILFPTIEGLEAAQTLIASIASWDIPVLVCSSLTDELRARELGADHCLLHPLTYDSFLSALSEAGKPKAIER